jgi:uncharacterized membrane protein YfcA
VRGVQNRLATGVIGVLFFLLYFGIYIVNPNVAIVIFIPFLLFCVIISSVLGNILGRKYADKENNDKLFYVLGIIEMIVVIFLVNYYIKQK